jgi:hypothetical protein
MAVAGRYIRSALRIPTGDSGDAKCKHICRCSWFLSIWRSCTTVLMVDCVWDLISKMGPKVIMMQVERRPIC